ncbi:MAG: hypothetical protein JSV22_11110 [Bacteroidales bacterium]|nr:MAG: hypothetical protein JSV22_11110 [Bacteroidales bacterium]
MRPSGISILSLFAVYVILFPACEKAPSDVKLVNKEFLLSRILKDGKIYQEYIYNDNKKLIRVNHYYDDSVYHFEAYNYNSEGKAVMKKYSDDYYETYEYDEYGRYIRLNIHGSDSQVYQINEYTYNSVGQIETGVVNYRDMDIRDITYTYDSRGNVLTRIEGEDEESQFTLVTSEYEYDNKNNPRYNWKLPTDIIQYNNPLRYIHQNALSCMMPPDYEYQYEYNSDGYPVKEIRNWFNTEVYDTFYYEYLK